MSAQRIVRRLAEHSSVVVPSLEEVDATLLYQVHDSVFLGQAACPYDTATATRVELMTRRSTAHRAIQADFKSLRSCQAKTASIEQMIRASPKG